jgi:hypothetical protein
MALARVELVIVSDDMDPAEIGRLVGQAPDESIWRGRLPASGRGHPSRENACVFRESAKFGDDFAYVLLSRLYSRVNSMVDDISTLAGMGCRIKLSVVQELSDGSASDGSFSLDESWLDLLARAEATLDVDLVSRD